jgi:hypothetical protein
VINKVIMRLTLVVLVSGCAGSPARILMADHESVVASIRDTNNEKICKVLSQSQELAIKHKEGTFRGTFRNSDNKLRAASAQVFKERGFDARYCEDPEYYKYQSVWDRREYFIDRLHLVAESRKNSSNYCSTGGVHKLTVSGTISPDSSFAVDRLLVRMPVCRDKNGNTLFPMIVSLESTGGILYDGYALGRSLRNHRATTIVENSAQCSSSCAVAYLGGN